MALQVSAIRRRRHFNSDSDDEQDVLLCSECGLEIVSEKSRLIRRLGRYQGRHQAGT
jgi:hypothetical protein